MAAGPKECRTCQHCLKVVWTEVRPLVLMNAVDDDARPQTASVGLVNDNQMKGFGPIN
jgi:hypothetical protein